jgi:urea transporter
MRLAFLAKYREAGFLLIRVSIGLPSIEMCFVLAGLLFIGPGKYSIDKT